MDCVDILKVKKQKLGPYGGGGGAPFFLDNITKIDKISVAYTVDGTNSFINAITITCIADGKETTHTWGKASGTPESVPPFCISILIDFNFLSEKCEVLGLGNAN